MEEITGTGEDTAAETVTVTVTSPEVPEIIPGAREAFEEALAETAALPPLPPGMAQLEDGTVVAVGVMEAYELSELPELAGFLRACGLDVTVLAIPLS